MPLKRRKQAPESLILPRQIDTSDDVAVSTEVISKLGSVLGLEVDEEELVESLKPEYDRLRQLGVPGELFVKVKLGNIGLRATFDLIDGKSENGNYQYPKTYIWDKLWVPGNEKGSYTVEDINISDGSQDYPVHARMALADGPNQNQPLLHFLDQPFDSKYAKKGEQTQLDAIAAAKAEFESTNPEFNLTSLNVVDFAVMAFQGRIKGESMPITWGFMRTADSGRKSLGGGSVVGGVRSDDARLFLVWSDGYRYDYGGVALSVGHNKKP